MKNKKIISIFIFASLILCPLIFMNTKPNSVSYIDNRNLAENPFKIEGDITDNIKSYVDDRIGFRDEMITAYTILNDKLFGKMVHPSYSYGKDGYVFGAGLTTENEFSDFHIAFANMVEEIQVYCDERNIPFLFVFDPAKPAIYEDKIQSGVNYNREWVKLFFKELDKRNINYLDNTNTLIKLRENGIESFNQKYDANHWNDIGAFYGTNAMLEQLSKISENIELNNIEELKYSEELQTSLLVSKFPINENIPKLDLKINLDNLEGDYIDEIDLDESYQRFGYYVNESKASLQIPKVLCFQGSYMNGHGDLYMANSLKEYIYVHNYQNVINFPYYFNIFQPDLVILEIAEYTFTERYFDYEKMNNIDFTPSFSSIREDEYKKISLNIDDLVIEKGEKLSKITWETNENPLYVWITLDKIYDMQKCEEGYTITLENKNLDFINKNLEIYVIN